MNKELYRRLHFIRQRIKLASLNLKDVCEALDVISDSQRNHLLNAVDHMEKAASVLYAVQNQMKEDKKGV